MKTLESSGLGGKAEETLRFDAIETKVHVRMAEENEEEKKTE